MSDCSGTPGIGNEVSHARDDADVRAVTDVLQRLREGLLGAAEENLASLDKGTGTTRILVDVLTNI